jgi:NADPH:quinone reductase-like Zn-dependent oxidoreductase
MKAILYHRYGSPDVLEYVDVDRPSPGDDEVLIRVRAASLNAADMHTIRATPLPVRMMTGLSGPKNPRTGRDVAGTVESVGKNVTRFKPGDEVFGLCVGSFAEYACTLEGRLAAKPANISFDEAAAVPLAALTALQAIRDHGHIERGQKVLIDGASGGVGSFAIQIAKAFGGDVTAVCSTQNVDTARRIGADHVIDYGQQDFTKRAQPYDLVIGANAYHSLFDYMRLLTDTGTYVLVGGSMPHIFQVMLLGSLLSKMGNKKARFFIAKVNQPDLVTLKELAEAGKIVPVIDRRYHLSDTAGALRYFGEGHARGKVVITIPT